MLSTTSPTAPLPQHTAGDAFLLLIDALATTLQGLLLDVMEQDGAEPVHRARVTLRRFRAAVTAFQPVLEEDLAETLLDRARSLFRILGTIRDADVMAARYSDTARYEGLLRQATEARRKARKLLKKKRAENFAPWLRKKLRGKSWQQTGKKAKALRQAPVGDMAARALNRAWSAALSNGDDLLAMTPRAQHELRKDLKMLRYLSEFFVDLWPAAPHEGFLQMLRNLQDDLGEMTDLELARSLGHAEGDEDTPEAHRAAAHWRALLDLGPWWAEIKDTSAAAKGGA